MVVVELIGEANSEENPFRYLCRWFDKNDCLQSFEFRRRDLVPEDGSP